MSGPTPAAALEALRALGAPERTAAGALGVAPGAIETLVRDWRAAGMTLEARLELARGLWASGIHEARLAAARLLTQARIAEDGPVWETILAWLPDLDDRALADQVAKAGERRIVAAPDRLEEVARWTAPDRPLWTRRSALAFTLPWSKLTHPSPEDLARRERVLGWAAGFAPAPERPIQQALAAWLRSLSKHDPERVRAFLAEHGAAMSPFARREAASRLG